MNQVINKKKNDVVPFDMEQYAGMGLENIDASSIKLPLMKILYSENEVLDDTSPKYNNKAKAGDFYNSITSNVYSGKTGMLVVPCYFVPTWVEWEPMEKANSTGRPVNIYYDNKVFLTTKKEGSKDYLPNGNYIEASGNHFCMIVDDNYNPIENVIIIMKSTQKTKSNEWNSMTSAQKIPNPKQAGKFIQLASFMQVYRLQTSKEKNKKGQSWWGYQMKLEKLLTTSEYESVVQQGAEFYQSVNNKNILGDSIENDADNSSSKQSAKKVEEDTPF